MLYENILAKHQLALEQLSKPTKDLIAKYNNTIKYLSEIEAKLAATTVDKAKNKLTTEIQEVKDYLLQLESQITKKIELYAKNKDVYAANAERLRKGRLAKQDQKGGGAPPVQEPAPASESIAAIDAPTEPNEPPATPESTKSKSGLGWLLGGIVGIGLAIAGINYYNNR